MAKNEEKKNTAFYINVHFSCVFLFIQDCMYLHELGDEAASFTKEDMQMG